MSHVVQFAIDVWNWLVQAWNWISETWETVSTWFVENVWDPILSHVVQFALDVWDWFVKAWNWISETWRLFQLGSLKLLGSNFGACDSDRNGYLELACPSMELDQRKRGTLFRNGSTESYGSDH
ncbi:hypothetical protein [Bacillus sp. GM1]|uniref:hypothetical protein n=1 Tax=Bacillus sp. GM1 TaxID=796348 RepID=UPI003F8F9B29